MTRRNRYRTAVGIAALGGLLISLMTAVAQQGEGTPTGLVSPLDSDGPCAVMTRGIPPASPPAAATPVGEIPVDLVYLDLSIPHAERLFAVAAMAADLAEHDALGQFGAAMAADLAQRERRLEVWRSLWFGERAMLSAAELGHAVDRLGEANPGRGGLPGAFEMLGMRDVVAEACLAAGDDLALLNFLIEAVDADLLLARFAAELGEHDALRFEARVIAERDQRWLDALIAFRERWYEDSATPAASPISG